MYVCRQALCLFTDTIFTIHSQGSQYITFKSIYTSSKLNVNVSQPGAQFMKESWFIDLFSYSFVYLFIYLTCMYTLKVPFQQ